MLSPHHVSAGLLAFALVSTQALHAAEDPVRSWPNFKCSLKRPGPDWTWGNEGGLHVLGVLKNPQGFALTLTREIGPDFIQPTKPFADSLERDYFGPGGPKRRGAHFLTFKDRPCYQMEGVFPDGRTTVSRAFAAHRMIYSLTLTGGKEPIENDPRFESIMDGFEFTVPPAPVTPGLGTGSPSATVPQVGSTQSGNPPGYGTALWISQLMGSVVFFCLLGAAGVAIFQRVTRKPDEQPKPKRKRKVVQEEDD